MTADPSGPAADLLLEDAGTVDAPDPNDPTLVVHLDRTEQMPEPARPTPAPPPPVARRAVRPLVWATLIAGFAVGGIGTWALTRPHPAGAPATTAPVPTTTGPPVTTRSTLATRPVTTTATPRPRPTVKPTPAPKAARPVVPPTPKPGPPASAPKTAPRTEASTTSPTTVAGLLDQLKGGTR